MQQLLCTVTMFGYSAVNAEETWTLDANIDVDCLYAVGLILLTFYFNAFTFVYNLHKSLFLLLLTSTESVIHMDN